MCVLRFVRAQADALDADPLEIVWPVSPACDFDAILRRGNRASAVVEVKSRDISLEDLEGYGSLLISKDKIDRCSVVSKTLGVPFVVFADLKDATLMWVVFRADGKKAFDYEVREQTTKNTCNDSTKKTELCAFLSVEDARTVGENKRVRSGVNRAVAPV